MGESTVSRNPVLGRAAMERYFSAWRFRAFFGEMLMKRVAKMSARMRYEPGASDCRSTGSVSLVGGGWWSADLVVAVRREDEILLTLRRHGAPGREGEEGSTDLCLRSADLEVLPALLNGVIAQARRDGVLHRRDATKE